jgi:hypothetical protein
VKRIYISGPMTGRPGLNFNAFHAAAAVLRQYGHEVINPADLNPDPGMSWGECMRKDIAALVTCDEIVMLPGWQESRGASLEHDIATRLGMRVREMGSPECYRDVAGSV